MLHLLPSMRLSTLLILALLPACTLLHRRPAPPALPKPVFHIDSALAAALTPAAASIDIDLTHQEMRLLNADKLPTKFSNRYGKFVKPDTREVVVWRTWEHRGPKPPGTCYEGYEMPHWLRLTWPGVGIHQGEFRPGELSSKGCIRTPAEPQQVIWEHTQVGTPVHIHGSSSSHPDAP